MEPTADTQPLAGVEWIVEAYGCDPAALRSQSRLAGLFEQMISELGLHLVTDPRWHQFPASGGFTGICILTESHLTCHSFPEYGSLCLNLFCCRRRQDWDFATQLALHMGAREVGVRKLERVYSSEAVECAAVPR
jgi:S-adenosylmethionine decarboxylase